MDTHPAVKLEGYNNKEERRLSCQETNNVCYYLYKMKQSQQ